MIEVTPEISFDESEIEEHFIRAGGPGGQNVNKVATAVQLRFDAAASPGLDDAMRRRLRVLAGKRMTKNGVVVITAERFRTRERNREDARLRLFDLLRRAAMAPKPRRATRPGFAARLRKRALKTARSRLKRLRAAGPEDP